MKARVLFLLFGVFCILSVNAQEESLNQGLDAEEFYKAQKLHAEMLKSPEYMAWTNSMDLFNQKATIDTPMGLPEKSGVETTREEVEAHVTKWLTKYVAETKFKSVDEGVELYMKSFDIGQKNMEKHREFYSLLAKANKSQIGKLMKPGEWKR